MIEFTLHTQLHGGKNHINITRSGHRYPNKAWAIWRDRMVTDTQIWQTQKKWRCVRDSAKLHVDYWPGDKRVRDLPALMDSLFHIFEKAGIVENDRLIRHCVWTEHEIDRKNPRVAIKIEELGVGK